MRKFVPSITFKQVQAFAKLANKADRSVGLCKDPFACLVSEALLNKYPQLTGVWVGYHEEWNEEKDDYDRYLRVRATAQSFEGDVTKQDVDKWEYTWQTPAWEGEGAKLWRLITYFDALYYGIGHQVYAGEVLPLFEAAA